MRKLMCYNDNLVHSSGKIIAFEEHRPGEEQEIVHVMISCRGSDGGPAAIGSVQRPTTWEPICVG